VLAWSLFTGLTGVVSTAAALIVIRFLFGLVETGAYPAAARSIYKWFPAKETGIAEGVIFAGSRLGAAFGLAVMSWTILRIGWRSSYLLLAGIGVAWALSWYLFFRDDLRHKGSVSESEREYIRSGRKQTRQAAGASVPWTRLLVSRESGILLAQYFASNFAFFLCFSWLLPCLKQRYSLTAAEAGVYSSIPLHFGMLANWVSGLTVDRLFKKGFGHHSRIISAAAGFLLAALALVAAANMTNVAGAVLCFAIATFGVDLTLSPSWTACIDIADRHTGVLSGAMNMIGNLGSFVSSVTFPMLVNATGGANSYFYLAALLDVLALALWWRLCQTDFTQKEK
jgi:ACS family glucarate transporter-like MFS transporter